MNQPALAFNDPSIHSDFDKPNKNIGCQVSANYQDQNSRIQFVKAWSAFVAKKAFTLPGENVEEYLATLRPCFTPQGWDGYSKALEQSGNLKLVESKGFKGNSQIIGMISVSHEEFTYLWEVNVPMTLVYQNKYQKLVQELIVHLVISEQYQGNFKVEQIIGFPQQRNAKLYRLGET
jgi:hypothetical protein